MTKLLPELDLCCHNKSQEHHEREHEEAHVVVSLACVHLALCVRPHVGVVEDDTHDEHEDTPAYTAVHPLGAVLILRNN